jgi:transposase
VIWLMQGQTPDHSTISGFVCRHGKHLQQLFRQTIKVALSADLVKLSHVAIDGTKLEADAGQGSVRSLAWLEAEKARLEAVAVALEKEWSANETWESTLLWSEQSPPPGDVRDLKARRASFAKRKQKVDQALAVIAQRSKESADSGGKKPKAIASLTDPESRVMPDKQGKRKPGYNGQIAVDDEAGIILANTVNDRPEDVGQMTPMLKQVEENTGSLPAACTLDSGYNSGDELAALEKMKVVGYLPDAGSNSGAVRGTPTPAPDGEGRGAGRGTAGGRAQRGPVVGVAPHPRPDRQVGLHLSTAVQHLPLPGGRVAAGAPAQRRSQELGRGPPHAVRGQ